MRRLFWVALGATAGILVARRLTRAARKLTPEGAAEQVSGSLGRLTQAVREFADDVRAGMAERDDELREALGIGGDGGPPDDIDAATVRAMFRTDPPTGPR
ncbi:MAG TPA: DUF6167 family protein [Jiangellaceae bacterium]|nr:DUF6167 family protein [Jiangellaceae bacterium]